MSNALSAKHGPGIEGAETLVYLVRHGLTDWNQEHRFQGQIDVPLNQEGLAQAKSVAQWMGEQATSFSALYSSDLMRAAQTAGPIGAELGLLPVYRQDLRDKLRQMAGLFAQRS